MLKIEMEDGKVKVSGSAVYWQPLALHALIEELRKAQDQLIKEQEKKAFADTNNFYEMWDS